MAKKLLIIEDEEYLSEMYKMKFQAEGFQVITAMDGRTGVELARAEMPDLILLDIVLPKMDGYEVLKKLREDEKTRGLKVYVLSNLGQKAEIKKGLDDGADGYLVKANLTPQQLSEVVRKILNGEAAGEKPED